MESPRRLLEAMRLPTDVDITECECCGKTVAIRVGMVLEDSGMNANEISNEVRYIKNGKSTRGFIKCCKGSKKTLYFGLSVKRITLRA